MKALVFTRYGKADHKAFVTLPDPAIKPDELLVRVHAVGLNPVDNMIAQGAFKPLLSFRLPAILGSDVAGVVVAVGSQVTRFKPGDAVFASVFGLGTGTLAEFAAVPERAAATKPQNVDFVEAASIPMVGLTSWQALQQRIGLRPGQKVFIPAGSGGIGTFAIQLAKHLGATVGTTTSTGNMALVRNLGADEVVDYTRQDFETVLRDYDAVLGTVRGDALAKALKILKPGSKVISLIGPPDAAFAREHGKNAFMRLLFGLLSHKIIGLAKRRGASYAFHFVRPDGEQLARIGALIQAGRIKPVIDSVFAFEQAREALSYLAKGRARGKVVVQLEESSEAPK